MSACALQDACRDWMRVVVATASLVVGASNGRAAILPTTDGFYGVWYSNQPSGDPFVYKYSGGLGTYPQQTSPIAIYSAEVDRTYFVYGGTNGGNNTLKNYISYYDHATRKLARPRELRHVGGNDVHKNATMAIDDDGYVWVFANSHGNSGSGSLYKSSQPHLITTFNEVPLPDAVFDNNAGDTVLAYTNPIYVPGEGFLLVWNQYDDGRSVHAAASSDGLNWTSERLMKINGHYTIARRHGDTVGIAANFHPGGLNHRTNLYYLETSDFAETWSTASGTPITSTLTTAVNPALVHNYYAEDQLVYLKDLNYDADGNPIVFYLTVSDATDEGYRSGPQPGGRTLHTAHWTDGDWRIRDVVMTDHNYDHGELYVEPDGTWRVIGPFIDGPQVFGTGGQVGVWTSADEGASWQFEAQWTFDEQMNHTYVRRPLNADDDFYALWANGNAFAQSASRLFFADKQGNVYRMPIDFDGAFAAPELVWTTLPDLNLDGRVDIFDVAIVSGNWGGTGEPGIAGDANRDGTVDIFDVARISNHWSASALPTPEPHAAALATIATAAAGLVRWRKRRQARRTDAEGVTLGRKRSASPGRAVCCCPLLGCIPVACRDPKR